METGTTAGSTDFAPTHDTSTGMEQSAPERISSIVSAEGGTAPSEPGTWSNPVHVALDRIAADVDAIKGSIAAGMSYDKAKEEAFDRLYRELDELRSDREFDRLRPLYLDLILLFDRLDHSLAPAPADDVTSPRDAVISSLRDELLEVLYRREIELIEPSPAIFDPVWQRAIDARITDLPDLHNSVASVVRQGFRYRGRLLRAEEVIVNKHMPGVRT